MKELVSKKTILIASAAILLAVVTLISVNVFSSGGPVTGLANTVSRPLMAVASQVARTFERIYDSIYRYDSLVQDYERLARRLAEFERDERESVRIAEENERLRALLRFRERHSAFDHEEARVVNRGGSNWSHSFTINRGYANSEIQRGNGVITEYGVLIGQVSEVGATNSTVITVLDTTFSASAFVGYSEGSATVKGDFNLMHDGLLMLDHIDDSLIILPGDTVVTAGVAGVFPPDLVLGEVIEVFRHSTGIGRYATVKPLLDINTISDVFIITDFFLTD